MTEPNQTPKKPSSHPSESSDGTIGPGNASLAGQAQGQAQGPGSSMSTQSASVSGRLRDAPSQLQHARKSSVIGVRDPSSTLSYSEAEMSGKSATEASSGEEDEDVSRYSMHRPRVPRDRSGTVGSLQRSGVSQSSAAAPTSSAPAAPSNAKGKRRLSSARINVRDESKTRRGSRDRGRKDSDDDGDASDDNGKYGPLDDDDDEVKRIDRGEELVRRRMKARQKEKALRRKAEKEREKQQQLARMQTNQDQQQPPPPPPLSPRPRPLSRQDGINSPSPNLEREGRPTFIQLPQLDPMSLQAAISPAGRFSPAPRNPTNYPSPHSHIRRASTRASNTDNRRASAASVSHPSNTVGAARSQGGQPAHSHLTDVFSSGQQSQSDAANPRADAIHQLEEGVEDEEERDTVADLANDAARSEADHGVSQDSASARRRNENIGTTQDAPVAGEQESDPDDNDEVAEDNEDDSGDTGESGSNDDVEYTLKDRQDAINIEHPFGLPIWKPALYKKSRTVTRNAESALHSIPSAAAERHLLPANLAWTIFAGVWLSLVCYVLAVLVNLLPLGGSKYARVIWELAGYLFWPFGKYVEVEVGPDSEERLAKQTNGKDSSVENQVGLPEPQENSYENLFTPVAARYPHDHTHQVSFNSRPLSGLELSTHDTIRPGDTIAAYKVADDQKRSSGSGSSGGEDQSTLSRAGSAKGYGTFDVEQGVETYTEAERIRQESDIYGYVHDDEGRDVGAASRIVGCIAYGIAFWLVIAPLMGLVCLACWGFVLTVPMAKLSWVLLKNLSHQPLALRFRSAPREEAPKQQIHQDHESAPLLSRKRSILQQLKAGEPAPRTAKQSRDGKLVRRSRILVCTYRAMGLQYYKYTVEGVNILFINTIPFVFFTILDFFLIEPYVERHHLGGFLAVISSKHAMFVFALGSVIPLSYFIGMAVASISAQSSIGMGAVINATFGSIIEIILYAIALTQDKARLVEGSIVGSILAGVLLMPGVSMCSGAMRRKEQRFNARSAGVTSTMLIMAIIGILTPTLFYQIYGTFQLTCSGCPKDSLPGETWTCRRCFYEHVPPATDPFYQENVKGLMYTCTVVLVFSYAIGLWFSLRTHASQIWQNPVPQGPPAGAAAPGQVGTERQEGRRGNVNSVGGLQIPNLPPAQRASIYKRILPAGVLQQLMPGAQRAASGQSQTVRSTQSRGTVVSDSQDRDGWGPPPLHLPEHMSAEDYERVLGSAAARSVGRDGSNATAQQQINRFSTFTQDQNQRQNAQSHQHQGSQNHQHNEVGGGKAEHDGEGSGGHDGPSWTRTTSLVVLIVCTILYATIAEILVDAVDEVLKGSGLDIKLLGVTLFALVPNATEFMNAMSFAIHGNIALSMEIGSAYALQVCLIQIPAMVAFSAFYQARGSHDNDINSTFTLIFPRWDVIAIIFAIFLLTYTYIESRSNYFRGSLCILSYVVLISGFVFAPNSGDPEDPVEDQPKLLQAIAFGGLQHPIAALPFVTQLQAIIGSLWTR